MPHKYCSSANNINTLSGSHSYIHIYIYIYIYEYIYLLYTAADMNCFAICCWYRGDWQLIVPVVCFSVNLQYIYMYIYLYFYHISRAAYCALSLTTQNREKLCESENLKFNIRISPPASTPSPSQFIITNNETCGRGRKWNKRYNIE